MKEYLKKESLTKLLNFDTNHWIIVSLLQVN